MKRKKRVMGFLVAAVFVGVLLCTGIYAYLTGQAERVNRLSMGENVIETEEEFPDPDPKPGGSVKKVVKIKNTGDVPCFVRTQVLFSNGEAEAVSTIDFNTEDWTERQEDGYHYYKHILPVGESSTALMTAIKIADNAHLEDLKDFQVIVYSESVQSEGYQDGDFLKAFESLTD